VLGDTRVYNVTLIKQRDNLSSLSSPGTFSFAPVSPIPDISYFLHFLKL
jgi:hypothetical protein